VSSCPLQNGLCGPAADNEGDALCLAVGSPSPCPDSFFARSTFLSGDFTADGLGCGRNGAPTRKHYAVCYSFPPRGFLSFLTPPLLSGATSTANAPLPLPDHQLTVPWIPASLCCNRLHRFLDPLILLFFQTLFTQFFSPDRPQPVWHFTRRRLLTFVRLHSF